MNVTKLPFAHNPLMHPASLGSLLLLIVNDHFLKQAYPSWLTGKLSDVSFMILAPIWLAVGAAFVLRSVSGKLKAASGLGVFQQKALLLAMIALIGCFFSAMQLTSWGDSTYRTLLGALQWPARASFAWMNGNPAGAIVPVVATPDPSDLLCLPLLGIAWWVGAPRRNDA